jgi:hypothetical protein
MSNLSVQVRHHDIVVTGSGTGYSVTYRRHPLAPMLELVGPIPDQLDPQLAALLASSWKAAYAKAKELNWL